MTVAAGYVPNSYAATGVAATYAYQFRIIDQTHLLVQLNGVNLTLTTDYTVDGVGQPGGGNITPVSPAAIVGTLVLSSNVPYSRQPDYQDDFRAKTFNDDQDLQTMQNRQLAEAVNRALLAPIGSVFSGQLPSPAGNGLKFLRLTAAATAIEYVDPGSVALAIPADGSVTTVKLAAGTQGDILYAGAAGVWAKLAAGTSGQYLKTLGAGANPTWAAAPGQFQPLTAAVNANALTFTLAAGAVLNFNDGSSVTLAAPITLTVPNTALMGTVNGVANRLWVVAMKNAGVPELAARNNVSGTNILGIDLGGTITSTVMDVASDSAQVWYSTAARAAQPFCVVGFAGSTQAAAGVWASAPTAQGFGPGIAMPGTIMQAPYTQFSAVSSGTTVFPIDDTIPQITEGDQHMTQVATANNAANVMEITYVSMLSDAAGVGGIQLGSALFQDAIANALAAVISESDDNGNTRSPLTLTYRMVANTAASITYRERAGCSSGATITFNGSGGARLMGGVMGSFMKVTEFQS